MNRFDEMSKAIQEQIPDKRVDGYFVFNADGWGSWLQENKTWGPFKTARRYFFYRRAESDRTIVTKTTEQTFIMAIATGRPQPTERLTVQPR